MRRVAAILTAIACAGAVPVHAAEYFQQTIHTTMHASLDTERHWISGTQSIRYVNNSPDTLRQFYLHLYPNAFRSKDTEYMRAKNRIYNWTLRDVPDDHKGWLDLANVRVDGTPVVPVIDDTIAKMDLPQPLLPGDSLLVELAFDGKVRKAMDRSGYRGSHYDMAQWYPKVAVYDENGFHLDKFSNGEFYGEFGTFDVHLDLPEHFVVVGTGVVQSGDPGWDYNPPHRPDAPRKAASDARKTVHFHAQKVHDFAWCADPTYVVQDTLIDGVEIRSAYRRSSAKTWEDSTLAHAIRAVRYVERMVGKYPYPQVTVAEMLRNGGMEYPMFIMDGRASESLVVHEVGHLYFHGILANDERKEAWLDEGFATALASWHKVETHGPWGDRRNWNFYQRITPQYRVWEEHRRKVFDLDRRGYSERVSYPSDKYDHSYRLNVYDNAALTINALRFAAGEENFQRILREYFDRWQFKHVNEERFRLVCEEVAERDLTRQFEQWLHTTKTVDYELERMRTRPDSSGVITEMVIKRRGDLYCPIEVHFTLADGSVEKRRFDARDRTLHERVKLPSEPVRVAINPDNEIMDADMTNNALPRRTDWQFDWPNNFYYPEDAYQIRHRPALWYNDVDGAKMGYHFSGSMHGWSRRLRAGIYYGAKSEEVDFSASFEQPARWFSTNATVRAAGFKMEGRAQATLDFRFAKRDRLIEPPTREFLLGYGYHELRDPAYLTSTEIYDTSQADTGPYLGFTVDPQLDIMATRFSASFRLGRSWFAGDYKYEQLALGFTMHTRPEVTKLDTRLRAFAGFSGGGTPLHRKFNLAGAGPVAAGERFWLRAPGAVPEDLHYVEPGDGNLRGYAEGTFGVNRLLGVNAEMGTRLRLFGLEKMTAKLLGTMSVYGFYDAGWILDEDNPIASSARVTSLVDGGVLDTRLEDAGVGIRSHVTWPFWNFAWRFDVPFWVSHPGVNGESEYVDFRWLFSLTSTF